MNFAEIAFLAVLSEVQTQGYGTQIMNKLKEEMQNIKIDFMLTYADNLAIGFFKKQGFIETSSYRKPWKRHIKYYEGGKLMKCNIYQGIKYSEIKSLIEKQREKVQKYLY